MKYDSHLTSKHPAALRYRTADVFAGAVLVPGLPEEDASKMLALLRTALRCGTPAAVCCQLAYSTTSRAFELLCATCEERGLVFVDSSKSAVGAVFYDRDPTWQHEIVSGALSRDVFMQMGRTVSKESDELLSGAPSPRVKLTSRSKEPDFAWAPQDQLTMDGNPTVVLEVAVFHESEEELLAEGSEWLSLPETQMAFLVKIHHEVNALDDCPLISLAIIMKEGQDIKQALEYTSIGKGSNCVQKEMEQFCYAVPWTVFLHGCDAPIPSSLLQSHFILDMYKIRTSVQAVYRGARLKQEAEATDAPTPSTSTVSFESSQGSIADAVKRRWCGQDRVLVANL